MSDTVNTTSLQENEATEEVVDKLAYTKKRYLRPKEIAAFVLVNFGQKNLSQFIDGEKQFFLVQYAGLNPQHFANIQLFATIYDALDDTLSGLIIDRTRTRWGREGLQVWRFESGGCRADIQGDGYRTCGSRTSHGGGKRTGQAQ